MDDRRAAETFSRQQADALVGRRRVPCFRIETLERAELGAVEVGIVEIAAGLQHDYVRARGGENSSGSCTSRARADNADVAGQLHFAASALPAQESSTRMRTS